MQDKAFNFTSNPWHERHQRRLVSIVYDLFFIKTTKWGGAATCVDTNNITAIITNQQLADESLKPINTKL